MSRIAAIIFFTLFTTGTIAQFHDQGFGDARVRTDYNSQTEGQPANPITFVAPCLFPGQICGTDPTTFDFVNYFVQNASGWPQSDYWVLSINNENAYDKVCPVNPDQGVSCPPGQLLVTTQNPGPPNQSLPRSSPGYGLMGFTAITGSFPGESFYRAHLVMNGTFTNPEFGGIPYLSIGAEHYRGNGMAPGLMNYSFGRRTVKFTARLWDFKLPTPVSETQPATLAFYLFARTTWGGKPRGLFITLAHWNVENSSASQATTKVRWNWPLQESFYHPGAELTYIDAEDIQSLCGFSVPRLTSMGQEISYSLNLQSLFQCASNLGGYDSAMPYAYLPIEGVHWAVEMTGVDGWMWPSVHGMEMA